MTHTANWYQRRLIKYFEDHYDKYDETVEYYVDPNVNQWSFEIVENGKKIHIILTSNDDGTVSEQRFTK